MKKIQPFTAAYKSSLTLCRSLENKIHKCKILMVGLVHKMSESVFKQLTFVSKNGYRNITKTILFLRLLQQIKKNTKYFLCLPFMMKEYLS